MSQASGKDGKTPANTDCDTRTRILEAAGPVFADRGFDGATVRDICSAADVNVASVGYYFGDKLGLYREVIRGIRDAKEREFPTPNNGPSDPRQSLLLLVRTILSRMLACDETGWEAQLFMREMQSPTPVFENLVREFFRPLFDGIVASLAALVGQPVPKHTLEQLALSVVGQCLYYKVGAGVVQILIPQSEREKHYDVQSLSLHITAVMIAAAEDASVLKERNALEVLSQTLGHATNSQD